LHGTCRRRSSDHGRSFTAWLETTGSARAGDANRPARFQGELRVAGAAPVALTVAPSGPSVASAAAQKRLSSSDVVPRVFLAVAIVILASRALGVVFVRIRQPRVVGEIVAGILLGPSLLGALLPDASHYLFPTEVISVL